MNALKLKKFLSKYLVYRYKINALKAQEKQEHIKAHNTVKAVKYDKEKVAKTNKIQDPFEKIDQYIDDTSKLTKMINDYKNLNKYIYDQINKMPNKEHRKLLIQIYVQYKNFADIQKGYKVKKQIYIDYEESIQELAKYFKMTLEIENLLPSF